MLLIKNTKIYTMEDRGIIDGDILIEDGKIVRIADSIDEKYENTIDGQGLITMPGIIDCHSHIGGMIFKHDRSHDSNEMTKNITPDVNIIYGTDPQSPDFRFARENGITSLGITPGSGNVICGQVIASKTYGDNIFQMTMKNPVALKVALGGNPKGTYGSRKQLPSTRMGVAKVLRDYLSDGREYLKKKAENKEDFKIDPEFEVLEPVFKKEIPLKIHCTQFDILTAIEIAKEFDLDFSLDHAWGAVDYIDEIVESGCEVVYGPIGSRRIFGELRLIDIESCKTLHEKGVRVSITTDAPLNSIDSLMHHLGEVVRAGLPYTEALKMLTINPAKVLRLEDRIGSIKEGKDGDLVIFRGLPAYETDARVAYTIIDGKIVYKGE